MTDPPSIGCPHCGQRYQMTPEQQAVYRGRTITCQQCAKPFIVDDRVAGGTMKVGGPPPPPIAAGPATAEVVSEPPTAGYAPAGYATPPGYGAYGAAAPTARGGNKTVWIVLASVLGGLVLIGLLCGSILWPALGKAREQAQRVACATNLRQVGMACMMYANENKGQLPDTIDLILTTQDVTSSVFVCPSAGHTPAPGATAQAQAANLTPGKHLSYAYVGKGLNTVSTTNASMTVVAYESPSNHGGDGGNFLFLDGHVEYLKAALAQQIINDLENDVNPPTALSGPGAAPGRPAPAPGPAGG
jgi:prepilin-type processing-associated H-X9-DG protein